MFLIKSKFTPLCTIPFISGVLLLSTTASAISERDCPISPTQFKVPISNPDPASEAGTFPTDLDEILGFVRSNNVISVKDLLDRSPDHMRKNYVFVDRTRGLGQTSVDEPGLMLFGSDGRFMMNMDTKPTSPRYEVVDLAYLSDAGDWEFKSLDFRSIPATLSPNGGNNGECRECHGQGGTSSNGPMRPFWGDYLDWPGIFSDNGQGNEHVTAAQAPALTRIQNGTQNPDRFHSIILPQRFFTVGNNINLPDHKYAISLTLANNEIGSAVTESIFKRAKRSPRYKALREEFLATAYCARADEVLDDPASIRTVSPEYISDLAALISRQGSTTTAIDSSASRGWMDIIRLWGLDPLHEFPVHKLTSEYNETNEIRDTSWSASSGSLQHQLSILVLLDLAEDDALVDSILLNNQTSYEMSACGILFDNQKEYLQHKVYANYTLKGNARQLARSSYYDVDYTRFHQTMKNVHTELCGLLTSSIGDGGVTPVTPVTPVSPVSSVDDACQQGKSPFGNDRLTAGETVCLEDASDGGQRQISLYVSEDRVGGTLQISMAHGSGNADLLHRFDDRPTFELYDQISAASGNEENLIVRNLSRGWHYIHVRANDEFSSVSLRAGYQ